MLITLDGAPELQWGRNLTVAEGMIWGEETSKMRMLQWGRNLTVAEGMFQRMRYLQAELLQWGRNLTVAEGNAAGPGSARAGIASMGPQLDSCGRRSSTSRSTMPYTSFNGAAT